jgi:hypothetical protein
MLGLKVQPVTPLHDAFTPLDAQSLPLRATSCQGVASKLLKIVRNHTEMAYTSMSQCAFVD